MAAVGAPAGATPRATCDLELPQLETERLEVNEELRVLWHRPPREVVEQQWRDPETTRVLLNGCFDLMHVGHFNALRQAKHLFYQRGYQKVVLVAGLHSDVGIASQKGSPLLFDEERLAVLRATKWVDELVTELPYVSMSSRLADLLRVDFICHGDDLPVCPGGGGMYSEAISQRRFQLLKRTEGISTTRILQRLLCQEGPDGGEPAASSSGSRSPAGDLELEEQPLESALATTQRLALFAAPADPSQRARSLAAANKVVYVAGTFDLLHAGHAAMLEQAARLGDYLLVGLYSDETVRRRCGRPAVLTLLERAMAILSMRPVDDVVLGAPWEVGRDLLTTLNVAVVVTGRRRRGCASEDRRNAVPQKLGILVEVDRGSDLSAEKLRERCRQRHAELSARNSSLLHKELAYIDGRTYVPEV